MSFNSAKSSGVISIFSCHSEAWSSWFTRRALESGTDDGKANQMHYARFQNVQKSYSQLSISCSRKLFQTRIFHVIRPGKRSSILVKIQAIVIKMIAEAIHRLCTSLTPCRYAATNKSRGKSNKARKTPRDLAQPPIYTRRYGLCRWYVPIFLIAPYAGQNEDQFL